MEISRKDIIISLVSGILAAIITLVGSYFLFVRPRLEFDTAWNNYRTLEIDIANKWEYSPNDPSFKDVESLCDDITVALTSYDFDTANRLIKDAKDKLRALPGPPVIRYYAPGEEWWERY